MPRRTYVISVVSLIAVALAGCGETSGPGSGGPPTLAIPARPASPVVPTEPALDEADLRLRLTAGTRFPLLKTVRQTLVQGGAGGGSPVAGFSELEMLLSVIVEEAAADGRTTLRVRFERITYFQDVSGTRFAFDSRRPAGDLPPEAAVYAAMSGDGFAFRIGPDNRITERVDFDAFLARCLAAVPEVDRPFVASRIAETSGDENPANFVDDSIGYLPRRANHGSSAAAGDAWRRERRALRPVRLFIEETCSLAKLDGRIAEIDVNGAIAASNVFEAADDRTGGPVVRVTGGHSIGHCRVDRATGLPVESRIERLIKLRVRPVAGPEFEQVKRVETTIRAFPRDAG